MTRRILLPLLLAGGLTASPDIRGIQVRLDTTAAGPAQGSVSVDVTSAQAGPLEIPLGFRNAQGFRLEEAPAGTRLEDPSARPAREGQPLLRVHLPEGVPASCTLRVSFAVPEAFLPSGPRPGEKGALAAGNRLFRHTFVQTREDVLERYRLEVLFPQGMMAQAIREALPKPARTEVQPRVRLVGEAGRQGAVLQVDNLRQGDDAAMLLELTTARKSWAWLAAGLILSVLYLVSFRDLVRKPKP